MDLTVVIVNWNGGRLLMRCLESLRAYADGAAVIVVDNNSSDGSREAAAEAFPAFQVINSGANLGFGRANNLARKLVTTSSVLFLNPDTEVRPGSLEQALRCLDTHPDAGAIGCKMLTPQGEVQDLGLQWLMTPATALLEMLLINRRSRQRLKTWLPTADPNRSGYVRKIYGGFMLVRREVMDAADWFDDRYFMYAEDADLCRTIQALGWKLYYSSEATIVHDHGGATVGAPNNFQILMKQESVNKLIVKYQGRTGGILHRAAVLTAGLLRSVATGSMWWVDALRGGKDRAVWNARCRRERQLVLWSLGLARAEVPKWSRSSRRAAPKDAAAAVPLSYKVLDSFAALEPWRADWDEAVVEGAGSIYMTYDWVRLWWAFYGRASELKVFLFWSADRLAAVVPMYIETLGAGPARFRVARLVGANIPPRVFNPPVPEQHTEEVFVHVLEHLFTHSNCDFLSFGPMSESEYTDRALTDACERLSGRVARRKAAVTVQSVYDLPATMDEYYGALSKNERKRRKKYDLRQLKKEYKDARVETLTDPSQLVEEFDHFAEQHRNQWLEKQRAGHFGSWPRGLEFHRSLVAALGKLGRVRFMRIVADGQVIARKYIFIFGDRYYAELNARSMDEKWERFSLGPSGSVMLIEQAITAGVRRIESGLEHYDHKSRLGAAECPVVTQRVVNTRFRSRLCFAIFALYRDCMRLGYHKIWYRRICPRLPPSFWRPQWWSWLRLDF